LVEWVELAEVLLLDGRTGERVTVRVGMESQEGAAECLRRMIRAGLPVCEFRPVERRLEHVFVEMVREETRMVIEREVAGPVPPPLLKKEKTNG